MLNQISKACKIVESFTFYEVDGLMKIDSQEALAKKTTESMTQFHSLIIMPS